MVQDFGNFSRRRPNNHVRPDRMVLPEPRFNTRSKLFSKFANTRALRHNEVVSNKQVTFQEKATGLQNLPNEILEAIFTLVIDELVEHYRARRGIQSSQKLQAIVSVRGFQDTFTDYHRPWILRRLRSILQLHQRLTDVIIPLIGEKLDFYALNNTKFWAVPKVFGQAICKSILRLHTNVPTVPHEYQVFLDTISDHMPKLIELRVKNEEWDMNLGGILHFLSLVVLRHPKLTRVIYPAKSGQYYMPHEEPGHDPIFNSIQELVAEKPPSDRPRNYEMISIFLDRELTKQIEKHDDILETTSIRRLLPDETYNVDVASFIITPGPMQTKDEIWTSEVPRITNVWVNQRAHRSDRYVHRMRWTYHEASDLIDFERYGHVKQR